MKRIRKNFIYATSYKLLELLLPLVTSPLLSRRLGAEMLGVYTYTHSFVSLFVMVAELGSYRYGMREIAKIRDSQKDLNQVYSDIFFTHAANGGVTLLVFLVVVFTFDVPYKQLMMVQGIQIIANMIDNAFFYVGIENLKTLTMRDATVKISVFLLLVVLVRKPEDLMLYVVIMASCGIVCKVIALIYARKFVRFCKPDLHHCKAHFRAMLVLMIPVVANGIYQSMDRIMIGTFYSQADVGYYECASKALIPKNIITVFGTVLCPYITNLYANGKTKEAEQKMKWSMTLSLILAYAFMFGIACVSKEFAPLFWGNDFSVCAELMIGLSISIPLWTIGEVIRNQFLLPNGRDHEYMASFLIGVTINTILNLVLIHDYGAKGAILATLAAEAVMSVAQVFFIRKEIRIGRAVMQSMPYFLIGIVMFCATRWFAERIALTGIMAVLSEIIVGAVLFIVLSVGYELLSKKHFLLQAMEQFRKQ